MSIASEGKADINLQNDFEEKASVKLQYTAYENIIDRANSFGTENDKESLGLWLLSTDFVF